MKKKALYVAMVLFAWSMAIITPLPAIAQEAEETENLGIWTLVTGAGLMVKFVMLVLVMFSVVSWAIIALKYLQIRSARNGDERFMEIFWGGSSLESIHKETRAMKLSPLAQLFKAGYEELAKSKRTNKDHAGHAQDAVVPQHVGGVNSVERALRRATGFEMNRLEKYTAFLATTGSTAPFVGLFGTVWGIMNSFRHIAGLGKVGMDVVAPGISEALIATAFGLAAAIPAVVAYNYFVAHTRGIASEMDNFSQDFLNIVQRHFI